MSDKLCAAVAMFGFFVGMCLGAFVINTWRVARLAETRPDERFMCDVPRGADNVSREIIARDAVRYVRATDTAVKRIDTFVVNDFESYWLPPEYEGIVYKSQGKLRYQWAGKRLLVRYVNGHYFGPTRAPQDILHWPLTADPERTGKPLKECLDPKDDGEILKAYMEYND
jgi:hypothetical protein